jgi:hypothetical protein
LAHDWQFGSQGNGGQAATFDEVENLPTRNSVLRNEVTDLRYDRLTDPAAGWKLRKLLAGPIVVFIARAKPCNDRAGVKDDRLH